jgi:hypothetical protein
MVARQRSNDIDGARHGHRHFDDGDCARTDRLRGKQCVVGRVQAYCRDDSNFLDTRADRFSRHKTIVVQPCEECAARSKSTEIPGSHRLTELLQGGQIRGHRLPVG